MPGVRSAAALPGLPPGGKARCPRCGNTLATRPADPLDRPLALTLAAAIVFIIAHTTPLMGLSAVGRHASTTIAGGALEMWLQGEQITAVIVAFCAVIAPGGYILFMLTVLLAVRRPPAPHWVGEMLRWGRLHAALVDERGDDPRHPGRADQDRRAGDGGARHRDVCGGRAGRAVPAIVVTFDPREIWKRVEWADGAGPPRPGTRDAREAR